MENAVELYPYWEGREYVYVIAPITICRSCSAICKIGKSSRPERRLRSLGGPFKLKLVYAERFSTADIDQAEKAMHALYANRRLEGEWFQVLAYEAAGELRALKNTMRMAAIDAAHGARHNPNHKQEQLERFIATPPNRRSTLDYHIT